MVAKSENVDALKRFVDTLAPEIRKLDPKLVTTVEDGTREVQDFFRTHKHLYADLSDIQKIHDDVIDRYDYEVQKKGGMDLGLDDAASGSGAVSKAEQPPPFDAQALEDKFRKKIEEAQKSQPGTDGYYIGKSKGQTYGVIPGAHPAREHGSARLRAPLADSEVGPRYSAASLGSDDKRGLFGATWSPAPRRTRRSPRI